MKNFLIIIILIVGLGIAGYFGFKNKDKIAQIASDINLSSGEKPNDQEGIEPDAAFKEPIIYKSLQEPYSNDYFSLKYPDGFKVSSNQGSSSEVIFTVENEKGTGFQIFVMSWDESGPITPERIWKDEPEADIIDPKNANLDGSEALVFYGYDGDLGETFEVWTVRKGKLYQITGPKTAEKLITETLETWTWK